MKRVVAYFLLLTVLWISGNSQALAQDHINDMVKPTHAINLYLSSLISGDTQQLVALIGGNMAQSNPQLIKNPETYSRFLKQHYDNVQAVVESVEPLKSKEDNLLARVRFDFPNRESSVILFKMTQVENQWLITDELTDSSD